MDFLCRLADRLWDPWLLIFFLLVGGYYTLRSGFFQIRCFPLWWRETIGSILRKRKAEKGKGLTQFQALSTALASTIGTGSIAGVATAIFYGGPGAVFWMWVSAFVGMMTGCAEKLLAVRYRERTANGWQGGPMTYLTKGLGMKWAGMAFALCTVAASLGGGNMVQANSIATSLEAVFGWERWVIGVVVAGATALVIFGGVGRIGKVSEKLVPAMALLFLGGGLAVICTNFRALPGALADVLHAAFTPKAALGGGLGYGIAAAMRYGIARGVFTNEAGLGSSAMAHAAADVSEPAEEGMWGIFEVFFATLVVCTVTALAILTTGVYDANAALDAVARGAVTDGMLGAPLSAAAFATVLGRGGEVLVAVCLLLFAFTSLLGWSYYGERGLAHLTGSSRLTVPYRLLFLIFIVAGSVGDLTQVWQIADLFNGLMAIPNLTALMLLRRQVFDQLARWRGRRVVNLITK